MAESYNFQGQNYRIDTETGTVYNSLGLDVSLEESLDVSKTIFDSFLNELHNTIAFENFLEDRFEGPIQNLKVSYNGCDFQKLSEKELLDCAKQYKKNKHYKKCLLLLFYGLQKFFYSENYFVVACPMITSCYRALQYPQEAICFANWIINNSMCQAGVNHATLVSVAAACCDIEDYKNARRFLRWAYKLLDSEVGEEWILVSARIPSNY